eukprot:6196013-Pleurochrysis_carterae.AAC.1
MPCAPMTPRTCRFCALHGCRNVRCAVSYSKTCPLKLTLREGGCHADCSRVPSARARERARA